jgi:hypothetical protein
VQWIRNAWSQLRPFSTGSYVNFQTADEGRAGIEEAYGENFARLLELKRTYDPGNLFRVNRNIASAAGLEDDVERRLVGDPD